jgi:hypothetical protein
MRKMLRHHVFVVCAAAGALAIGVSAASADVFGSASVSVGSPTLLARVAVTVPIQYSCAPLDSFSFGNVIVVVTEASGQKIATGSTMTGGLDPSTCDNATHSVSLTVFAGSTPFHGGQAVVQASVSACGTIDSSFGCESASTGPQVVTIRA